MSDNKTRARAQGTKKKTRIQKENEQKILDVGLELFSSYGFRGVTVDQIARQAGMSKPNLLYYYRRKHDIYEAVLKRTLDMWLLPLDEIRENGDPETELRAYINRKIELSREQPKASRLFLNEILQGAPLVRSVLMTDLRNLISKKATVIRAWAKDRKIKNADPYHLIFMIWATTQHYADFESQIKILLPDTDRDSIFDTANQVVPDILLHGMLPKE